jgi:hypothetical protein
MRVEDFECSEHGKVEPVPACPHCLDEMQHIAEEE